MAQYSDAFMDRLELIWGRGFLSPGGPAEVGLIVDGLELDGRDVLDIGAGLGGPARVLAAEHGARVVGVDVEEGVLDRARRQLAEEGLSDRIRLRLVAPGPLPFADGCFDVVFSKDSLVHIPDKRAIYDEMRRVLRPGGWVAVSDWMTGPPGSDGLADFLEATHLDLSESRPETLAQLLAGLGFEQISMTDRSGWFASLCAEEQARLAGPLAAELVAIAGEEEAAAWYDRRQHLARAAASGGVRPTHVRARKPVS